MNLVKVKTGVYICHGGTNIAAKVDVPAVAEYARSLDHVVLARDYTYMCSDPGQDLIKQDIKDQGLNRVVLASCTPLMHEPTFRRACKEAGLNPFFFQMANIREHCSWVVDDPDLATEKAKHMVSAAVSRVHHHRPLEMRSVEMHQSALVLGGGIAGFEAALRLGDSGQKVDVVVRDPSVA